MTQKCLRYRLPGWLICCESDSIVPQYFYIICYTIRNVILVKEHLLAFKNVYTSEGITEPVDTCLWYESSQANSLSPNATKVSYPVYMGVMMCVRHGGTSQRDSVL